MSDYPGSCPPQNLRPPSLVVHGDSDDDFDITNLETFTNVGVDKNNDSFAVNRQLNRDAIAQNSVVANLLIPSTTESSSSLSLPTMNAEDEAGDSPSSPGFKNPFNFQTQVISAGPVKSRPPPVLPASLPIPTVREAWKSMTKDQRIHCYWSMCHLAVATYIFFRSEGSLATTALSHLVFFDAGSAAVCVMVDILGNFEVWRRSSIRHPFGLERAEVLAGFAMSVFLLFGGFDLVSHTLKHFLESLGNHEAHHEHGHDGPDGSIDLVSAAAMVSTLVSAYGLRNHARIAKLMRVSYLAALPSVLSNPFHFLTLSFSAVIALLPLLSISLYTWLDRLICVVIAFAMFALGMRLAVAQGLMLLMSYGGNGGNSGVSAVLREIETEPSVVAIDDAQFWQVHYGLCMANLK
ncbi:cation diffusion zinc membrane transporter Zrg17 [Fusarium chlamydosporum]